MKKFWNEIFTWDNLGHLALWLAWSGLMYLCYLVHPLLPMPASATLYLFMREKDQISSEHFDHDFRKGWPWQKWPDGSYVWSLHKWMEWIPPSTGGWIIFLILLMTIL